MTGPPQGAGPMRAWVDGFPEMFEEAWGRGSPDGWPLPSGRVLLIAGMGGSVMAGALAAHVLEREESGGSAGRIVVPWPWSDLPPWFSREEDRLLAVSYSGATWETLRVFEQARARGATIRAIGSGGELLGRAAAAGIPTFAVPGGMAPRASLPWLLAGVLRAGGYGDDPGIASALGLLRRERAGNVPGREPEALAAALDGRLIVLLPVGRAMDTVALRWRNQILENAKAASFVSPLPEMGHNEIMGWGFLAEARVPAALVAMPRADPGSPPWDGLLDGLRAEAARSGLPWHVVPPPPGERLASLLAQVYFGDRLSVCLAERRGVDPVPVDAIGRLRRSTGKESSSR